MLLPMPRVTRRLLLIGCAALTVSCAPFGEGALGGGGSSSSFSSVGTPVPAGSADIEARNLLMNVSGEAIVVSIDAGTFAGLDPAALTSLDPSVRVAGDVPTRVGIVSINVASHDGLVMSTKSRSGRSFCVSVTGLALANFSPPEGGTVDAHGATSPGDCTGKDWVSNP
jgi:hypothetical protein